MKKRAHPTGNAIIEYGLILGLVAAVSVAAINLLGGANASLFTGSANTLQSNQSPMSLLGAKAGNGKVIAFPGNVATPPAGIAVADTTPIQATRGIELSGARSGGGTNSTSVDGNTQQALSVKSTLATAQALQALADSTSDALLKHWYQTAADNAFQLAGSEATYSYVTGANPALQSLADTKLGEGEAIRNIFDKNNLLAEQLNTFPPTGSQQQKDEALALVNQTLSGLKNDYGAIVQKYGTTGVQPAMINLDNTAITNDGIKMNNGQQYSKSPEEVAQASHEILQNSDTPEAVASTLVAGQTLNDQAAAIPAETGAKPATSP